MSSKTLPFQVINIFLFYTYIYIFITKIAGIDVCFTSTSYGLSKTFKNFWSITYFFTRNNNTNSEYFDVPINKNPKNSNWENVQAKQWGSSSTNPSIDVIIIQELSTIHVTSMRSMHRCEACIDAEGNHFCNENINILDSTIRNVLKIFLKRLCWTFWTY